MKETAIADSLGKYSDRLRSHRQQTPSTTPQPIRGATPPPAPARLSSKPARLQLQQRHNQVLVWRLLARRCNPAVYLCVGLEQFRLSQKLISLSVSYTHLRAHETRHDLVC